MANTRVVLLETLQDLVSEELDLFTWHLKNGVEGFARIKMGMLENAKKQEIVDKMVEKYGISGAEEITLIILKKINRNQLAEELKTKLSKGGSTGTATPNPGGSSGAVTPTQDASKAAFIDANWVELVERATAMEPILDRLLQKNVINKEQYHDYNSEKTQGKKMQRLYTEALTACGDLGKAILYDVLMVKQPFMMRDLGAS